MKNEIVSININKFPLVIISDSHTNLSNVLKVKSLYPDNQIISLGDITNLWDKKTDTNAKIIDYFIREKIPNLTSNHEEYVGLSQENSYQHRLLPNFGKNTSLFDKYNIEKHHIEYLINLPLGFKITIGKKEILLYHNAPKDVWSHQDKITKEQFLERYPITNKTALVGVGHHHLRMVKDFGLCKMVFFGRLAIDGEYALLTEKGIEFKKL